MRLQHIHTMIAIAETGSLRAAAKRLKRTQPALTKSLRQMEVELGVALFQRTPRGVVATETGHAILARVRSIAQEIQRLEQEVDQRRGGHAGSVKICVSPLGAALVIPKALMAFRRKYPLVDVHVVDGLYPVSLPPLRDGQIDLLIGPMPPSGIAREFHIEQLVVTETIVITSKNSPYARAKSLTDLVDAQWIMLGTAEGPGDVFEKSFRDHGLAPPIARTKAESYFAAIGIVEISGALCAFPARLFKAIEHQCQLVRVPIRESIPPFVISMLSRAGVPLTPAAEEMANCIRRRANTILREA